MIKTQDLVYFDVYWGKDMGQIFYRYYEGRSSVSPTYSSTTTVSQSEASHMSAREPLK